jgi:hypothetical protein
MTLNSLSDFHTNFTGPNDDDIYCHRLSSGLYLELAIGTEPHFPFTVSILNEAYKPGVSHWDDHVYDWECDAFETLENAFTYANTLAKRWETQTHHTIHGPKF